MLELEKNNINIGRNPNKAIQKLSQPVLEKLRDDVDDDLQPRLQQNMIKKADLEGQIGTIH